MTLEGKVAEVLDNYKLVANIGESDGVEKGMKFEIYEQVGGFTDPDTHEELGSRTIIKAEVKAVEVYKKMAVLKSAETFKVNLPRLDFLSSKTKTKKLPTKSSVEDDETIIERGDLIRQISEEEN